MSGGSDKVSILRKTYSDIFKLQIEGHEKIIPAAFHQVVAPLTKIYFYDGKDRRYSRFHTFLVWGSGTGKGELMKLQKDIIESFNVPNQPPKYLAHYSSGEINPQALRGGMESRYDPKAKKMLFRMIPGMLKNYCYIAWGEGDSLISTSSSYANSSSLQNLILNITDDPGHVTFAARKDLDDEGRAQEYITFTNISAGSTPDIGGLNIALLKRGFLSRFIFDYEPSSDAREKELASYIASRPSVPENFSRFNELLSTFKDEFYTGKYEKEIHIPPAVAKEYAIYKLEEQKLHGEVIWERIINSMYGDKKDILKSYFRRSIINDKRIAAQVAAINGQNEVDMEYLEYASKVTATALDSLGQFLSIHLGKDEESVLAQERKTVINVLHKHPKGLTQSQLVETLLKMRGIGMWTKGTNATRALIKKMVFEHMIKTERGERNAILYKAALKL